MPKPKATTYPPIQARISWAADSNLEQTPIARLKLSQGAFNALQRVGIRTVGQVMRNWDRLTDMPPKLNNANGTGQSGLGAIKAKEIRAVVFALLCARARVELGIDLEGCEQ